MCWTISEPVPSGDGQLRDQLAERLRAAGRGGDHDELLACRRAGAARGAAGATAATARRRGERARGGAARLPLSAASLTFLAELGGEARPSTRPSPAWRRGRTRPRPARRRRGRRGRGRRRRRRRPGPASALPARSARSTPSPSRPGMCRSSVSASGPVLVAGGERLVAVGRGGDHVEALAPERVGEDAAHQARVVGDDDALRAGRDGWPPGSSGLGGGELVGAGAARTGPPG